MSRLFATASISLGLLAIAAASLCAQPKDKPMQESADVMFQRLDVNKDSRLSMDDARDHNRQFLTQIFTMAGKPTTGWIGKSEFTQIVERHRRGETGVPKAAADRKPATGSSSLPPIFNDLDDDEDGQLSRDELARLADRFDQLDADGDGKLNSSELSAAGRSNRKPDATPRSETPTRGRPASAKASEPATDRSKPVRSTPSRDASPPNERGASRLAGVWRGWVVDGRGENPNQGHMEMELRIEGNRMVARELGANRAGNDGMGEGTFTITGAGDSGNLDATGTTGQYDGQTYLGIFQIQGDTLRWCVGNRGRARPRDYATGRGNYLMILRKQE